MILFILVRIIVKDRPAWVSLFEKREIFLKKQKEERKLHKKVMQIQAQFDEETEDEARLRVKTNDEDKKGEVKSRQTIDIIKEKQD